MRARPSSSPPPPANPAPADGKLGVLLPGLGAVATTLIAGVHLVNKGLAQPFGALTQMQKVQGGHHADGRFVPLNRLLPLTDLTDLVFGGWDIFPADTYQSAAAAGVLPRDMLAAVREELEAIRPWPGAFEPAYVRKLRGRHIKRAPTKMHLAEAVMHDIEGFRADHRLRRAVMIWCGSTEIYHEPGPVHETLGAFERGLKENAPEISPSMIYAYAALASGIPFANGAPNLTVDIPALLEFAAKQRLPVAGKDFKTGQTFLKTVIAPGLRARMLGLHGWFSTNILGNRDGEVLDDPASFRTKEVSKSQVLDAVLQPELYPALYASYVHKVRIEYYPPRGDAKEGWDNVDIFGWLGQPMQIKINFLCRDSILAAPLALDLILLLDLAKRAGLVGAQEWLSFYFKSPMCGAGRLPEHDLFVQHRQLMAMLRSLAGAPADTRAFDDPLAPPGQGAARDWVAPKATRPPEASVGDAPR
jgi:myo-inositol-1-phosphate synthase